jgi:hypothetical protein
LLLILLELGESLINDSVVVTYEGTWHTYPTLVVTGPASGFKITNDATGDFIQMSYELDSGDTITISLPYGNKEVTHSNGADLIGSVLPDSNLADFSIVPDPEASGGTNTISIIGAGAGDVTALEVQYNTRFIGI